jgi:hypothetical protein
VTTAALNGQLDRMIETPLQRSRGATTSIAPRQCSAWLSPISATPARASAPKKQGETSSAARVSLHGALGVSSAADGVGVTIRRRSGFEQGRDRSIAAAPKHFGCASSTERPPIAP